DFSLLTSALQFLHGPPGLINGAIGVGIRSRIRIGDGNPAERLTRHLAGNLSAIDPEFIPQRVVFVRIAVRPAVHSYRSNIARRIESARPKRTCELIADITFHG